MLELLPSDIKIEILHFLPALSLNRYQREFIHSSDDQQYLINHSKLIQFLYGYLEKGNIFLLFPHIEMNVHNDKSDGLTVFNDRIVQLTVPWYHVKKLHITPGHYNYFEELSHECLQVSGKSGELYTFPNLQELSLQGNTELQGAVLQLLHQFPNLKHLNISGTKCSHRVVTWALTHLDLIRLQANAMWGMSVKQQHLLQITDINTKLEVLELHRSHIGDVGLRHVFQYYPNLKVLKVGHNSIGKDAFLDLPEDLVLHELDVCENPNIGLLRSVSQICESSLALSLKKINVCACGLTDPCATIIATSLPQLEKLDISMNPDLSPAALQILAKNNRIIFIDLCDNEGMFSKDAQVISQTARSMAENTSWSNVILARCELPDELFTRIPEMLHKYNLPKKKWQYLDINGNKRLNIQSFYSLITECLDPEYLETLVVENCTSLLQPTSRISSKMMGQALRQMRKLEYIDIAKVIHCNDEFACELIDSKSPLRELDVSVTNVTDLFLDQIATNKHNLNELSMQFNRRISVKGINKLIAENKSIDWLDFQGVIVDETTLELILALPKDNALTKIDLAIKENVAQQYKHLLQKSCSVIRHSKLITNACSGKKSYPVQNKVTV